MFHVKKVTYKARSVIQHEDQINARFLRNSSLCKHRVIWNEAKRYLLQHCPRTCGRERLQEASLASSIEKTHRNFPNGVEKNAKSPYKAVQTVGSNMFLSELC